MDAYLERTERDNIITEIGKLEYDVHHAKEMLDSAERRLKVVAEFKLKDIEKAEVEYEKTRTKLESLLHSAKTHSEKEIERINKLSNKTLKLKANVELAYACLVEECKEVIDTHINEEKADLAKAEKALKNYCNKH